MHGNIVIDRVPHLKSKKVGEADYIVMAIFSTHECFLFCEHYLLSILPQLSSCSLCTVKLGSQNQNLIKSRLPLFKPFISLDVDHCTGSNYLQFCFMLAAPVRRTLIEVYFVFSQIFKNHCFLGFNVILSFLGFCVNNEQE